MRESRFILLAIALRFNNDWNEIAKFISSKEDISDEEYEAALNFKGNFISIFDPEYPVRLKHLNVPPFILYYEGDISLLSSVDKNEGRNDLIHLYGNNIFGFNRDLLVTVNLDGTISFGAHKLILWSNKNDIRFAFLIAAGLCHSLVCTRFLSSGEEKTDPFVISAGIGAAFLDDNTYFVPSLEPSCNNLMIKSGCFLIDCLEDVNL